MKGKKLLTWILFALAMVCFVSAPVIGAEFVADVVQHIPAGTMTGKVYVKGKNYRQEMTMMGMKHITIYREDKDVAWVLMPAQMTYMEMKGESIKSAAFSGKELEEIADKKYLGEEKVNGYKCKKYRYVYHDKSMGTVTQWVAKKLDYPIKIVMESPVSGKTTIEYKNIKQKKLSNSLFVVPKEYEKMNMPMMPGMGRQ